MALSQRKEMIIKAVVDSYIDSCEPISSAEIKEKYLPSLSTATIRNELAALEEMGYLTQPHVSSGRIPTSEAYRMYVDKLMPKRKLSKKELSLIKKYFGQKLTDMDTVVRNTAKVISEITNLTSVACMRPLGNDTIVSVKIVKITETVALFIIVTDRTIIKDTLAEVPKEISEEYFASAGKFITDLFKGHKISEAENPDLLAKSIRKEYERVFDAVIKILRNYNRDISGEIVLEGSSKILDQPEYTSLNKAKAMLRLLDAKEQLYPVLAVNAGMNLNIKIAGDNEVAEGMPECAIVTASYEMDGGIGSAGVIGPMRMDYPKVVSVLEYIGKILGSFDGGSTDDQSGSL